MKNHNNFIDWWDECDPKMVKGKKVESSKSFNVLSILTPLCCAIQVPHQILISFK